MNIVERIRQIVTEKGISERAFCREIGVANGFLNKVSDVGSDKLNKILYKYPEVNPAWLLTGNGEMKRQLSTKEGKYDLLEETTMYTASDEKKYTTVEDIYIDSSKCRSCMDKEQTIERLERHISDLKELIRTKEQLTGVLFSEIDRLKNMYESNLSKDDLAG